MDTPHQITSSKLKSHCIPSRIFVVLTNVENCSTIARTLNAAYTTSYSGLRDAYTTYPVSAFITHLVYLEGTNIEVDTRAITVRYFKQGLSRTHTNPFGQAKGVKCIKVQGLREETSETPKFDAPSVREAILDILSHEQDQTRL